MFLRPQDYLGLKAKPARRSLSLLIPLFSQKFLVSLIFYIQNIFGIVDLHLISTDTWKTKCLGLTRRRRKEEMFQAWRCDTLKPSSLSPSSLSYWGWMWKLSHVYTPFGSSSIRISALPHVNRSYHALTPWTEPDPAFRVCPVERGTFKPQHSLYSGVHLLSGPRGRLLTSVPAGGCSVCFLVCDFMLSLLTTSQVSLR